MNKYLAFVFLLLFSTPLYAQVDLQDGLIAYYPFANGVVEDLSANNNPGGIVVGATPTTDRAGNYGNAFSFNGVNDYVELGNHFSDLTLPFSLSIWLFRPGDIGIKSIMASNNNASNYYGFFMSLNDTETLAVSYGDGGPAGAGSRRSIESTVEMPEAAWVHVVAVLRSPDDMSIYFDGVDAEGFIHGSGDDEMVSADFPATAGFYNLGVNGAGWEGGIDDIRVYDRALNVSEVNALYTLAPDVISAEPSVIITEIMKDPDDVTDSAGEWFELFNVTDDPINMNGWMFKDLGTDSHVVDEELIIEPHSTLVMCKITDRALNGDVGCDYRYTKMSLGNRDDAIIILDDQEIEIDRVVYDDGITYPSLTGASMFYNAGPEEDNNDGNNWLPSFDRAGNYANIDCPICDDLGTPGMVDSSTLPVEMSNFEIVMDNDVAHILWETASETNNAGFEVYHKSANNSFEVIGWVPGAGTTSEMQRYAFKSGVLGPGRHVFRIKQIDFDGQFSWSNELVQQVRLDKPYFIRAPYPNPYNPTTTLTLSVQKDQQVTVELFNLLGQRISTSFNEFVLANTEYDVQINSPNLPSGRYLVRVHGETFTESHQVYLVK